MSDKIELSPEGAEDARYVLEQAVPLAAAAVLGLCVNPTAGAAFAPAGQTGAAAAGFSGILTAAGEAVREFLQPKIGAALVPAVPANESVADGYVVSLIDGKQYVSLAKHLRKNGMTGAQYREAYGLAPDHPLVAPAYTRKRAAMAKAQGLGIKNEPAARTAGVRRRLRDDVRHGAHAAQNADRGVLPAPAVRDHRGSSAGPADR